MMAIETRFYGPTNHLPSRIRAKSERGAIMLNWEDGQGIDANHGAACRALAEKYGWTGTWVSGSLDGGAQVWVHISLYDLTDKLTCISSAELVFVPSRDGGAA